MVANTLNLFCRGAVGFIDWLDPDAAFLAAMHADELAMASDVKCNCNPRSDAGKQKLARRIQRAKALNEQAGMSGWTAEPERQRYGNALTHEKNRERDPNEPWRTGHQHGNDAHKHDCQPKTRPHDEPRLSVESAGDGLFDRVHEV